MFLINENRLCLCILEVVRFNNEMIYNDNFLWAEIIINCAIIVCLVVCIVKAWILAKFLKLYSNSRVLPSWFPLNSGNYLDLLSDLTQMQLTDSLRLFWEQKYEDFKTIYQVEDFLRVLFIRIIFVKMKFQSYDISAMFYRTTIILNEHRYTATS